MAPFKPVVHLKPTSLGLAGLGLISTLLVSSGLPSVAVLTQEFAAQAPAQSKQVDESTRPLPGSVRDRVLQYVANDQSVPASSLTVVRATAETWPDPCLGVPDPLELCAAVLTPGYRVEVSTGTTTYTYRTDTTGQTVRQERQTPQSPQSPGNPQIPQAANDAPNEVADVNEFPRLTASRVLDEIMRTSDLPLEQLDIVATQRRTWDGCYGLASSTQACPAIAIMGWQVIVTGPDSVWVYHTNQDGTEIRRNDSASQIGMASLVPEFIGNVQRPDGDGAGENALFSVVSSGGISGETTRTVLYLNGNVVRYSLGDGRNGAETPLGTLSATQLASFVEQFQGIQLERFLGLRYPTPAGTADSITLTVMPGTYGLIQYDDSTVEQLPLALQQFHTVWNTLLSTAADQPTATPGQPPTSGASVPFTDIAASPYAEEIRQAANLGLMAGMGDRQFRPEEPLTREQLVALVQSLMQQVPLRHPDQSGTAPSLPPRPEATTRSSFNDVATDRWSTPSIEYLHELGLIQGYPDGSFRPEQPVTRAELVSVLMKMDIYLVELRQWDGRDAFNLNPAEDFSDTQGHWAERSIAVMSENCQVAAPLTEGSTAFAPDAPATRGYAAAAVVRSFRCLNLMTVG